MSKVNKLVATTDVLCSNCKVHTFNMCKMVVTISQSMELSQIGHSLQSLTTALCGTITTFAMIQKMLQIS